MVSRDEGNNIATTGNIVNQDWDAAWDSDENEDSNHAPPVDEVSNAENKQQSEDDDGTDAWGWGDDDTEIAEPTSPSPPMIEPSQKREVTLSEKYSISSMPQPVFDLVTNIYDDGAKLAKMENAPVAKAVAGLFLLPTIVLAMYRAVSPHYYTMDASGNMYVTTHFSLSNLS